MSEITRLVLVRHAQPKQEARGHCYGTLDIGLSVRARRHAQLLARTLDRVPLAAVYTSPSQRAVETAAPLAATHGLKPISDEALHGRSTSWTSKAKATTRSNALAPSCTGSGWKRRRSCSSLGGESYRRLRAGALRAMEAIRARHLGETVAVVSHGGVLRAMLADCLSMPDEAIFRLDQSHGAISIIDCIDSAPVVRPLNAQPRMVAAKRRGFLPAFASTTAAGVKG